MATQRELKFALQEAQQQAQELQAANDELRAQSQAAAEEAQQQVQELQSANDELQSANDELAAQSQAAAEEANTQLEAALEVLADAQQRATEVLTEVRSLGVLRPRLLVQACHLGGPRA